MILAKILGKVGLKDTSGSGVNPATEETLGLNTQLISTLVKKTPVYSQDEKGNIRMLPQGGYTKAYSGFDGSYDDSMFLHYSSSSKIQANIQRNLLG